MKSSLATMIDVTARNIAETRIKKLYTAVEHSPTVVIITNLDGIIEYVNPKFSDVTGYSSKEVLGQTPSILNSDTDQEMLHKDMWETIQSGDEWRGDFLNQKKDGSLYRDHVSVSPVKDENGKITHYVSIQEDITEESKLREKLSYHASHDELTGLINRREFEKRVTRLISTNQHSKSEHALCFMDLDQFKIINDTKGHPAGDEVLRQVANLLQKNVRNRDTLARLGGDEFGLLFEHCTLVQARRTLDTILLAVRNQQFQWEGEEFHLGISIGLVGMSETTTNFTELLKLADAACYAAKDSGRNRIHVFHSEDHGRT
jgi:diguanylate cyclase (GGDEF)-like protein/PAS domain S-box-containing protein